MRFLRLLLFCAGCRDAQTTVQPQVPIMYVGPGGSGTINMGGPSAAPSFRGSEGPQSPVIRLSATQCSAEAPCVAPRLCVLTWQGGRCADAEMAVGP
jgi:hypothetical protein